MDKTPNYKGSCHCGNVQFELMKQPQWLVACNCSICSRIAALWAHADTAEVKLHYQQGETIRYVWGDKSLEIHSCKQCGCTTHWESMDKKAQDRMAVNFRMCTVDDVAKFAVRKFDGADSWEFLD